MSHLISVEIDDEVAKRIKQALVFNDPLCDKDSYLLQIAIEEALEGDDG